jgi:hypothetical protein
MNYYEELGLAPDAADEDIRRAHHILSKLLHPDLQTDPAAREAAELQMRRINAIFATLLDPHRRREYDANLRAGPVPVLYVHPVARDAPAPRRFGGPAGILLLTMLTAALILSGVSVWFLDRDLPHLDTAGNGPATPPEKATPAGPRPLSPRVRASAPEVAPVMAARVDPAAKLLRNAVSARRVQENVASAPMVQAPSPVPQLAARNPEKDLPAAAPPPPVTARADPAPTVLAQPAAVPPAAPPRATLAGLWLYAPDGPKGGKTKMAVYTPEFIQLQILVEDGFLRGEYSARYRVPDRLISSEVAFHFAGKSDGAPSFEWQSDDGSRGVVDLRIVTAESLQVNWRVSRFGTHQGLGAGTALLIRKINP